MSIIIKDMDMPKNCLLCPFCVPEADEDNGEICAVSGQFPLMNKEERNVECPLIELPPHGDLIDRDEGIKIGAELAAMHESDATTQELEKEYWHGYEDAMQRRDIKPVVHGKWVLKTFNDGYGEYQLYECNLCGAVTAQRKSKNYCPNCGAKMESEE